jgi:hypothetical protein
MAAGVVVGGAKDPYGNPTRGTPPPGYTFEPNTGRLIPIAGSATDVLEQRTRQQTIEDQARQRTQSQVDEDRRARDALRSKLVGMLDRPLEDYSGSGYALSGGSVAPIAAFDPSSFMTSSTTLPAVPDVVGKIELPDTSAAQANLFARAKDKVGLQTAGSLAALRSALAGRGMLGGGGEVRGAQNILTAGQAQLGDTTREQAIQEAGRLTDFAKMGYEGAITQRGQDITARGQDISAQESARNAALDAAKTAYEGQIATRGQDITQRGQDINAKQINAGRRYDSVTGLLGKLY